MNGRLRKLSAVLAGSAWVGVASLALFLSPTPYLAAQSSCTIMWECDECLCDFTKGTCNCTNCSIRCAA